MDRHQLLPLPRVEKLGGDSRVGASQSTHPHLKPLKLRSEREKSVLVILYGLRNGYISRAVGEKHNLDQPQTHLEE